MTCQCKYSETCWKFCGDKVTLDTELIGTEKVKLREGEYSTEVVAVGLCDTRKE